LATTNSTIEEELELLEAVYVIQGVWGKNFELYQQEIHEAMVISITQS